MFGIFAKFRQTLPMFGQKLAQLPRRCQVLWQQHDTCGRILPEYPELAFHLLLPCCSHASKSAEASKASVVCQRKVRQRSCLKSCHEGLLELKKLGLTEFKRHSNPSDRTHHARGSTDTKCSNCDGSCKIDCGTGDGDVSWNSSFVMLCCFLLLWGNMQLSHSCVRIPQQGGRIHESPRKFGHVWNQTQPRTL